VVDLNAAYQDAKFLSDDDLRNELANPSGMIPGYIVMSELQDRNAIRTSAAGAKPQMSMKDEMLQSMPQNMGAPPIRQYSRGGMIAQLNPFNAMAQAMRNPKMLGGLTQDALNNQSGGLPSLQAAQSPGAPQAPSEISSLQPTAPGVPQEPLHYAMGGLASLYRR
jgi:hypothetical protein